MALAMCGTYPYDLLNNLFQPQELARRKGNVNCVKVFVIPNGHCFLGQTASPLAAECCAPALLLTWYDSGSVVGL